MIKRGRSNLCLNLFLCCGAKPHLQQQRGKSPFSYEDTRSPSNVSIQRVFYFMWIMEDNPFLKDAHLLVLYGSPKHTSLKLMEENIPFFINRKGLFSFFDRFGRAKRSTKLGRVTTTTITPSVILLMWDLGRSKCEQPYPCKYDYLQRCWFQ